MTVCYRHPSGIRAVANRHLDDCPGNCNGCQPCTEVHCEDCGSRHVIDGYVCPHCLDDARSNLRALVDACALLPDEREARGQLWSEAACLAADTADYDAWTNRRATLARTQGVLISDLEPSDDTNARWVLRTWISILTDAWGEEYTRTYDVAPMADWVDARLYRLAHDPDQDFGQLRREVRRARLHVEVVVRDQDPTVYGAPCPACAEATGVDGASSEAGQRAPKLQLQYGATKKFDQWVCPNDPRHAWDDETYRRRLTTDYRSQADWLSAADLSAEHGIPQSTLRQWASEQGLPGTDGTRLRTRRPRGERVLYDVRTAVAARDAKASVAS